MTMRMMVALSATLFYVGSTWAQSPGGAYPTQPPYMTGDAPPVSTTLTPARGDGRFWVSGDYAAFWVNGTRLPALVTTSPTGTDRTVAGVLGQPNTTTLFGGSTANDNIRSGVRLGAGYWFGDEGRLGVEAGFSMLESQASLFSASSNTYPILARPFTDATNFSQQAVLVAFPGLTTGTIGAQVSSGNFYEGHVDLALKVLEGTGPLRLDALLGYRYIGFNESLRVQQNMSPTNPIFVAGTTIRAADDFSVNNQFHGLDLGLRPRFVWEALTLDLLAKVSIGDMYQVANVSGAQVITVPGAATVQQAGGVLGLGTNIGTWDGGSPPTCRCVSAIRCSCSIRWPASATRSTRPSIPTASQAPTRRPAASTNQRSISIAPTRGFTGRHWGLWSATKLAATGSSPRQKFAGRSQSFAAVVKLSESMLIATSASSNGTAW
jgi:hypothetical protein